MLMEKIVRRFAAFARINYKSPFSYRIYSAENNLGLNDDK
jgi:hypothetical protein